MTKQITLTPEQFAEVQRIKRDGEPEWKAVATVLNVDPDSFITTALGTPSAPRDGLKVTFIK